MRMIYMFLGLGCCHFARAKVYLYTQCLTTVKMGATFMSDVWKLYQCTCWAAEFCDAADGEWSTRKVSQGRKRRRCYPYRVWATARADRLWITATTAHLHHYHHNDDNNNNVNNEWQGRVIIAASFVHFLFTFTIHKHLNTYIYNHPLFFF